MYLVVEDNDGGNKTVMVAIDESAVPGEGRKEEEEEEEKKNHPLFIIKLCSVVTHPHGFFF